MQAPVACVCVQQQRQCQRQCQRVCVRHSLPQQRQQCCPHRSLEPAAWSPSNIAACRLPLRVCVCSSSGSVNGCECVTNSLSSVNSTAPTAAWSLVPSQHASSRYVGVRVRAAAAAVSTCVCVRRSLPQHRQHCCPHRSLEPAAWSPSNIAACRLPLRVCVCSSSGSVKGCVCVSQPPSAASAVLPPPQPRACCLVP